MQSMYDFLNFRLLISPDVLIIFYYLGAIFMPYAGWLIAKKIDNKVWLLRDAVKSGKEALQQGLSIPGKARLTALVIILFISLEIMWRMMFEVFIAYFQMREALINLAFH